MVIPKIEAFEDEPPRRGPQRRTPAAQGGTPLQARDPPSLTAGQKAGRFFIGVGIALVSLVLGIFSPIVMLIAVWWFWNRRRWIAHGVIWTVIAIAAIILGIVLLFAMNW